jgi:hypothetical protein
MYELKQLERYLRVNFLGTGPRLLKKVLPGRGLTSAEKHWYSPMVTLHRVMTCCIQWLSCLFSGGKAAEARP